MRKNRGNVTVLKYVLSWLKTRLHLQHRLRREECEIFLHALWHFSPVKESKADGTNANPTEQSTKLTRTW